MTSASIAASAVPALSPVAGPPPVQALTMTEALPGFPGHRDYVLVAADRGGLLFWLQSVAVEGPRFLAVPAGPFFPDYAPALPPAVCAELGLDDPADARLYCLVSVLGGESQQKKTLRALDGAAGVLQGRIGKELGLRRTPRLEFVYDRAVEQGVRMTRLIDELAPPTETTMPSSDIDAVVEALRAGDRFVVTSHDNPDGDALGSLLAMHLALVSLGKDSVMVLGGEQPLPGEFGFLRLEEQGLLRAAPDDVSDRVLVAAAHLPGKVPEAQRLSEAELVAAIRAEGRDAVFVPSVDAIVAALAAELRPGDRVAILSNGGFGGIHEKLLRALASSPES